MRVTFVITTKQTMLVVSLSLITLTSDGADMNRLRDCQWKSRLVLVQAGGEIDNAIETLRSARPEIEDRNIVWFVNTGSDVVSNQEVLSSS